MRAEVKYRSGALAGVVLMVLAAVYLGADNPWSALLLLFALLLWLALLRGKFRSRHV